MEDIEQVEGDNDAVSEGDAEMSSEDLEYTNTKKHTLDALKNLRETVEGLMPLDVAMGMILQMAHLPDAKDFVYSDELHQCLQSSAENLQRAYRGLWKADQRNDVLGYKRQLENLFEKAKEYAAGLTQQFLKDNLPETEFGKFKKGRIENLRVSLDLAHIRAHLGIIKELARDDIRAARQRTRTYVLEQILHLPAGEQLSPLAQKLVKEMTNLHFRTMRDTVFPAFEKSILAFADKGHWESFKDSAVQAKDLLSDWVRTPFNSEARDRMAYLLTPSAQIGFKGHAELFPMIWDIVSTSYNVSINHAQFLSLLDTILGRITFDALIIAATWGAGLAVKGGQVTGAAAQGLKALTLTLSTTRSVMAPPVRSAHHLTNVLTVDLLKEKVVQAVSKTGGNLLSTARSTLGGTLHEKSTP